MNIEVYINKWIFSDYEWKTQVGDSKVLITSPRPFLVKLKRDNSEIVVSKEDLRRALNALDQAGVA